MQNEGSFSGSTSFYMSDLPPLLPSADGRISADKILIFSTEKDTQLLLGTLLEMWGYETEICDDLEKSLAAAKQESPKLILLDSSLPFEAHLENLRQIRRNKYAGRIPIIVMSGFSQPECRSLALALGADDFLVKPLDFDTLEICLQRQIEKGHGKTSKKRGNL